MVLVSDALAFSTADIFAAGFIDNGIGKVICTDANMAAAGGNNWGWDVVRLFNPDFRIDGKLKVDFTSGKLFETSFGRVQRGRLLFVERGNTVVRSLSQFGGTVWTIQDGALSHLVRDVPWMSADLEKFISQRALPVWRTYPLGSI